MGWSIYHKVRPDGHAARHLEEHLSCENRRGHNSLALHSPSEHPSHWVSNYDHPNLTRHCFIIFVPPKLAPFFIHVQSSQPFFPHTFLGLPTSSHHPNISVAAQGTLRPVSAPCVRFRGWMDSPSKVPSTARFPTHPGRAFSWRCSAQRGPLGPLGWAWPMESYGGWMEVEVLPSGIPLGCSWDLWRWRPLSLPLSPSPSVKTAERQWPETAYLIR